MDLIAVKNVGIAAANRAVHVLRSKIGDRLRIEKKGDIDLVTEADRLSEACIIDTIQTCFPDHTIVAEESGRQTGRETDFEWYIDPLDGTTNFAHRIGVYAVSIAFALRGKVLVGIVLNPSSGELFTASKGSGAHLNGRPIRVSKISELSESLLATGFPYNIRENHQPVLERFGNCLLAAQGVRRMGSAAIDLCHVACGRVEGFWEQYLKPWDMAAGMLIAREAGATVTDFEGRPTGIESAEILATNGGIHAQMLKLLKMGLVSE